MSTKAVDLPTLKILSSMAMLRIERRSTLTPMNGSISPGHGLLCLEVIDRKLRDLAWLGEEMWLIPRSIYTSTTTTASASTRASISPSASPIMTATPASLSKNRNTKSKRRPVRKSIASRLPVRSQATIHRRSQTTVTRNLLPRAANRATYNRHRTFASPNRITRLRN